jgi:LmbE family N-acetylglucosaminyl deacetylase
VPTGADYHPDHKMVHRELLVSLFHASGAVWPELGEPLLSVPSLYEMAIYADFPGDPSIQLHGDNRLFDTKLAAVEAYRSQEQIAALLHSMRQAGPYEYFRETPFRLYDSRGYRGLFENLDD